MPRYINVHNNDNIKPLSILTFCVVEGVFLWEKLSSKSTKITGWEALIPVFMVPFWSISGGPFTAEFTIRAIPLRMIWDSGRTLSRSPGSFRCRSCFFAVRLVRADVPDAADCHVGKSRSACLLQRSIPDGAGVLFRRSGRFAAALKDFQRAERLTEDTE